MNRAVSISTLVPAFSVCAMGGGINSDVHHPEKPKPGLLSLCYGLDVLPRPLYCVCKVVDERMLAWIRSPSKLVYDSTVCCPVRFNERKLLGSKARHRNT